MNIQYIHIYESLIFVIQFKSIRKGKKYMYVVENGRKCLIFSFYHLFLNFIYLKEHCAESKQSAGVQYFILFMVSNSWFIINIKRCPVYTRASNFLPFYACIYLYMSIYSRQYQYLHHFLCIQSRN